MLAILILHESCTLYKSLNECLPIPMAVWPKASLNDTANFRALNFFVGCDTVLHFSTLLAVPFNYIDPTGCMWESETGRTTLLT